MPYRKTCVCVRRQTHAVREWVVRTEAFACAYACVRMRVCVCVREMINGPHFSGHTIALPSPCATCW